MPAVMISFNFGHALCRQHREPARSRANISHHPAGSHVEDIEHTINLQPFRSPRRIKDRKIAGVGLAGFSRLRRMSTSGLTLGRSPRSWRRILGMNANKALP